MALATLSIDLVAQLAKFEADMGRAARVAELAANRIGRGFGGIGAVFTGSLLASGVEQAVLGVVRLVPQLVEGVARFQDLEEKTGASAEALAGFQTAADVAGISVDQIAGFMVKLTGTLSKTNDETKGAGAALKALGLDLEGFRNLAPEQQFETLAKRLEALPAGATRTAVAIALLGKSGAEALPFLKELASTGLAQNRLTAEQIRLADELTDRNAKLRSELRQAAQVAALQALPAFNALFEVLGDVAKSALGTEESLNSLASTSGIREFAEGVAQGFTVLADAAVFASKAVGLVASALRTANANRQVAQILVGDPRVGAEFIRSGTGALKVALDEREKAVADSDKRVRDLLTGDDFAITNALKNRFATSRIAAQAGIDDIGKFAGPAKVAPGLTFTAPDTSGAEKRRREAEQLRKAQADEALNALERINAAERNAVQFQQRFLDAQQQQGLLNLGEFYARRAALDERALEVQLRGFDAEATALRESLQAPDLGAAERVRVQGRIADVEAKAAQARQGFSQDAKLNALEEARGYEQAADRVTEFRAQVLELQGDLARAAELRAGLAIEQARRTFGGDDRNRETLRQNEEATRRVDAFTDAQRRAERAIGDAAIAEERFLLIARASGASRAEIEQGITAIRRQAVEQLGELVRQAEAATAGLGPDSPAVQGAQRLRIEFERAAAQVDLMAERLAEFADTLSGQIAGTLTDAILDGDWKSAGRRIASDIARGIIEEDFTRPLQDELRKFLRGGEEGAGSAAGVLGGAAVRLFTGETLGTRRSAQPSAERDALRRTEAAVVLEPLGDAVQDLIPTFDSLSVSTEGLESAFTALPSLLGDIFSGIDFGGALSTLGSLFFHRGGIAGVDGEPVRYHSGGLAGLRPDEVPAILQGGPRGRREEVLTARDPRHRDNGGGGGNTFNFGGIRVDSSGAMDRMAEERAARNVAIKAQRYLQRRGA